jgi:hypothetical protein
MQRFLPIKQGKARPRKQQMVPGIGWGASWNYRHPERGNPKSETRSPKQTPSIKQGMTTTTALLAVLSVGPLDI